MIISQDLKYALSAAGVLLSFTMNGYLTEKR
jgi:hypothetical protein